MLVLISDLHITDGSTGEHNLPTRAFDYFFDDLVAIAKKPSNNIREIKLVLLGDIFDLLRTEKWFQVPEDGRPWGNDEAAIEDYASRFFDAIVEHNSGDLDNHATSAPSGPVWQGSRGVQPSGTGEIALYPRQPRPTTKRRSSQGVSITRPSIRNSFRYRRTSGTDGESGEPRLTLHNF